jgi:hypothetical protein
MSACSETPLQPVFRRYKSGWSDLTPPGTVGCLPIVPTLSAHLLGQKGTRVESLLLDPPMPSAGHQSHHIDRSVLTLSS